jgi:hypothetical protein
MTPATAAAILIGANQIREQIMPGFPAWDQMTDKEKLEFLQEYCDNQARKVEQQGGWINDLHARLRKVEGGSSAGT